MLQTSLCSQLGNGDVFVILFSESKTSLKGLGTVREGSRAKNIVACFVAMLCMVSTELSCYTGMLRTM